MKGVGRLTKNELIKFWGHTGIRVLSIIVIILMVAIPVGLNAIKKYSEKYDAVNYEERYENATYEFEKYTWKGYMRTAEEFSKRGIDHTQAMYVNKFYEISDAYYNIDAADYYLNGNKYNSEDFWSNDYSDWSQEELKSFKEENQKKIDDFIYQLDNNSSNDYYKDLAEEYKKSSSEVKAEYEAAKSTYDKEKNSENELNLIITCLKYDMYMKGVQICDLTAKDSNIEKWKSKTVELAGEIIENNVNSLEFVSKGSFEMAHDTMYSGYSTYEDYVKSISDSADDILAKLDILIYSVENNISIEGAGDTDSKMLFRTGAVSSVSLIVLFMMVAAAIIIASEYTTGTIRLLLIRPRSRWKILLSKILAISIITVFLSVLAYAASLVSSICFNGVGDIFGGELIYFNGVKSVNYLIYALGCMAANLLPGIMLISFSVLLAVLCRHSVVAIVVTYVLNTFASVIHALMVMLLKTPEWLSTILPFKNMQIGDFVLSPFSEYGFGGSIFGLTSGLNTVTAAKEIIISAAVLLIYAIVATTVTFLVFRKQQIKN